MVYQGYLKRKTVMAELDSAIHCQKIAEYIICFKINDMDTVSVLLLYRLIFTVDCRIKFGNDAFDGFRQHLPISA